MEFIIGGLIGIAIGATGIGGGTLTAPALIILGFAPRIAVATALLFSSLIKIVASGLYLSQRKVDFRTLTYLLCGGVPGALLGAFILEELRSEKSVAWILLTVGILVVVSSAVGIFHFKAPGERGGERLYLLSAFSFIIGNETGFSSAGAGALGTVMLFNFTGLSPAQIVGTDMVFGLILSVIAGGIHSASCDYVALCKLVPAGLVGVLIGSRISRGLSATMLRRAVLVCTMLVGALLLRRGLAGIL